MKQEVNMVPMESWPTMCPEGLYHDQEGSLPVFFHPHVMVLDQEARHRFRSGSGWGGCPLEIRNTDRVFRHGQGRCLLDVLPLVLWEAHCLSLSLSLLLCHWRRLRNESGVDVSEGLEHGEPQLNLV